MQCKSTGPEPSLCRHQWQSGRVLAWYASGPGFEPSGDGKKFLN